ncbi:DUF1971 domain-containing protein [Hyphococcus sp.]|uniref:DUF1971 domain-containing protein n=1 Tax=Hyphococcus sp. TaxID=2038636 RepID=UPI002084E478|nr:MAG: hypothetical protein DHS20C04_13640 [Marinicaulis sp.]
MHEDLPNDVQYYSQTPIFTETTTPAKLTALHDTKPGIWGKLVVLSGALDYIIPGPPAERRQIGAGAFAIIEPAKPHRVTISGPVRYRVEFYR